MSLFQAIREQGTKEGPLSKILKVVNDYTIYCHLIGFEVGVGELIRSPLRVDEKPTFNIFPPSTPRWDGQLLYKDYNGDTGNIWNFVKQYARSREGIILISQDEIAEFITSKLGGGEIVKREFNAADFDMNKERYISCGEWTQNHLDFWEELGVGLDILNLYDVRPCYYLLDENDKIIKDFKFARTYAYIMFDKYKLYQPEEINFVKFYNQCPKEYMQGYAQCRGPEEVDTLCVTKAMKDILVYQAHSERWIDIIAPHGEGYIIDEVWIRWMLRYKNIVIVFDPDLAGIRGANRLRKALKAHPDYKGQNIRVDFTSYRRHYKRGKWVAPMKDAADFRLVYGGDATRRLVNHFFYDWKQES